MANIYVNFKMWLRGLLTAHATSTENVEDQVNGMFEQPIDYVKAAVDGSAAATTAADYFYWAFRDIQVVSAKFVSAGTAAANGSNFATIIVNKHDGVGGAATVSAQGDTSVTSIAAGVPFTLTPSTTLANTILSAGQVMSFQITKTGTGVAVPAGNLVVFGRYL
jgi:hypothetical protein